MKQGPSEKKEKSTVAHDGGQPHQNHRRRQRRRVLQIELPGGRGREGEEDEEEDEMKELQKRIEKAQLPEHALKIAQKELKVNNNLFSCCKHMQYFLRNCICY